LDGFCKIRKSDFKMQEVLQHEANQIGCVDVLLAKDNDEIKGIVDLHRRYRQPLTSNSVTIWLTQAPPPHNMLLTTQNIFSTVFAKKEILCNFVAHSQQ